MINLYSTTELGARFAEMSHSGSLDVYCEALRVRAEAVFQSPRAETLPELTVAVEISRVLER